MCNLLILRIIYVLLLFTILIIGCGSKVSPLTLYASMILQGTIIIITCFKIDLIDRFEIIQFRISDGYVILT